MRGFGCRDFDGALRALQIAGQQASGGVDRGEPSGECPVHPFRIEGRGSAFGIHLPDAAQGEHRAQPVPDRRVRMRGQTGVGGAQRLINAARPHQRLGQRGPQRVQARISGREPGNGAVEQLHDRRGRLGGEAVGVGVEPSQGPGVHRCVRELFGDCGGCGAAARERPRRGTAQTHRRRRHVVAHHRMPEPHQPGLLFDQPERGEPRDPGQHVHRCPFGDGGQFVDRRGFVQDRGETQQSAVAARQVGRPSGHRRSTVVIGEAGQQPRVAACLVRKPQQRFRRLPTGYIVEDGADSVVLHREEVMYDRHSVESLKPGGRSTAMPPGDDQQRAVVESFGELMQRQQRRVVRAV
ncbi:hypothetical protein [Saccharopolyspora spinosa]|uniref:hypothetical protein n=1 Tax=Saccharopolyspora spinosa TaxID=60894 RepID=UPI000237A721|nr:hypothetical protein [Saccharopolyspora spinosa]